MSFKILKELLQIFDFRRLVCLDPKFRMAIVQWGLHIHLKCKKSDLTTQWKIHADQCAPIKQMMLTQLQRICAFIKAPVHIIPGQTKIFKYYFSGLLVDF